MFLQFFTTAVTIVLYPNYRLAALSKEGGNSQVPLRKKDDAVSESHDRAALVAGLPNPVTSASAAQAHVQCKLFKYSL